MNKSPARFNARHILVGALSVPLLCFTPIRAAEKEGGILLNFQDAPLSDVLNHLSEAAGFIIVADTPPQGTVNAVSHQPLSVDEAYDLLNTLLLDKGYVAIRNGRILKIVARDQAHKQYLPVHAGSNPETIPMKEEMVTQILPVRHAKVEPLIETLRMLLNDNTRIAANEDSNAIVMTDTQMNIRRVAEILDALDTSVSSISSLRVFPLEYADATELAEVMEKVFESSTSSSSNANGGNQMNFRMGGRGGRPGGQTQQADSSSSSTALAAGSKVVTVADERSNSLIVSAPEGLMETLAELIEQVDVNVSQITEVKVFQLENADALEVAEIITELFEDDDDDSSSATQQAGFRGRRQQAQQPTTNQQSERSLAQAKVVAVADPRTNSLLVTTGKDTMFQVAELVGRLDATSAKRQQVFVFPLAHADVDNVAAILRGMFGDDETGTREGQVGTILSDRADSGTSTELNSSFGGLSGN
ncbi:secretin N-terminal domain-containing protein [Kiritimatiellaeota bacterium B1221]|nr:secretin N-terminal domain-containing protein [Kiritimatiellaeota bacterium B1221]